MGYVCPYVLLGKHIYMYEPQSNNKTRKQEHNNKSRHRNTRMYEVWPKLSTSSEKRKRFHYMMRAMVQDAKTENRKNPTVREPSTPFSLTKVLGVEESRKWDIAP